MLRRDGAQPDKTESYSDVKAARTDCGCAAGGVGRRSSTDRYHTGMRQLHHVRTRIGGVQGGQGNRLKGSVSGEPRCRLCALITLRAVHSDLEFAAPRDADLPDEGRAYVEHVTTPDSLRERSGGSQTSSELAMARASALRA